MKKLLVLATAIFATILLSHCETEEETDLLLFVQPEENFLKAEPKERIDFQIECTSNHQLTSFKIGTKSSRYATDYFFDTTLHSKDLKFNYSYTVPASSDKKEITLVFTGKNEQEQQQQLAKSIEIERIDTLLSETTGHTFYSHLSEEADGYNLLEKKPVYTNYGDSSDIHIYDASTDSIHGNQLSGRWETMADAQFVKYGDFDYANATNISIERAFSSGTKKSFVADLHDDDIILVKLEDAPLMAIKIMAVLDQDGTLNDRYIFNLKK